MAIFKIKTMGGQEIVIEDEQALQQFLSEANTGKKLIITKYGIVNVSSIDSIIIHKEKMMEITEALRLNKSKEQALSESLGPSPFVKLLSDNMRMLSDQSRTSAQEEAARGSRNTR